MQNCGTTVSPDAARLEFHMYAMPPCHLVLITLTNSCVLLNLIVLHVNMVGPWWWEAHQSIAALGIKSSRPPKSIEANIGILYLCQYWSSFPLAYVFSDIWDCVPEKQVLYFCTIDLYCNSQF